MGHPHFTPQCHWGSCLVGRRCPGEDKREKVGLDNTVRLQPVEKEPPEGLRAAAPAGIWSPRPTAAVLAGNEQLSSLP